MLRRLDPGVTDGTVRRFGVVMLVGFGLLGGAAGWLARPTAAAWLWGIGGVVGVFALALPGPARPVFRGWMAVAHVLGRINTTILLALFWLVLVVPLALVFKLIGRDALQRRVRAASYWEPKTLPSDPKAYFNQF